VCAAWATGSRDKELDRLWILPGYDFDLRLLCWKQEVKKMKKQSLNKVLMILFLGVCLFLVGFSQQTEDPGVLLRAAIEKEEVDGDLLGAIDLYKHIIEKFNANKAISAQAQLRTGLCYEKLGQKSIEQAQEAFQKVIDNYPNQTDAVNLARRQLLALQKAQLPKKTSDDEFRIRKVDFPFPANGILSMDGNQFSYRDDSGDLAIVEIETGKKRPLTKSSSWDKGDFVSGSIISPNSKYVAYAWCTNYSSYDLKIVNIDGSGQRVLYHGKITPSEEIDTFWPCDWTPDNEYILGNLNKGKKSKIALISAKDGSLKIIKEDFDIGPEVLDLSPDGRWIVFDCRQAKDSGKYDIFLVQADGKSAAPLVKHPADDRLLGWTASGDSVLMASDRAGSWDAWILPVKDGKASGEPLLVKSDFGFVGGSSGVVPLGFVKAGSFYYQTRSWLEEVQTATLDIENAELLSPPKKVAQRFEGTNCYADWSPDGKYLAFSSSRGRNSSALCVLSTDGGEQRDIFPHQLLSFVRINWFPDGKSVIGVGRDKEDRGGIYRVNIETGEASPIVREGGEFHSPKSSPDGKSIFYGEDTSWEDKLFRIMQIDTETGYKKEFYRSTQQIIRLDISPDGELLAFLEPADGTLKVMPSKGGQPKVVFKIEEGWSTSVAWSPDGKYLLFTKIPEGEGKTGRIELWRISSEGGEPEKFPLVAKGMENVRVHPGGKRIAFNTFERKCELWVMENFLPKTKAKK
jgi:Tol biopolymer transport system component